MVESSKVNSALAPAEAVAPQTASKKRRPAAAARPPEAGNSLLPLLPPLLASFGNLQVTLE